ncbi:autocrine proliferation repressor A-like [Brachionus plicatilis]|uniref:Autocrine proliferation repressor A-like n=1 Tax=Brachionus plicatilis TaxID=10195 RepID=A0A3M7PDW0_BRAPC|nr:autocrine proliferation repressor A-like [Brachionus plicatilis]
MITYNYSSRKIFCHILCFSSLYQLINGTSLDDYVNEPDDNYKYEILKMVEFVDYKLYYINMTSQKWQNESIVDRPIWWHWMSVSVPNKITRPDASFIFIGGNNNNDDFPDPDDTEIRLTSVYAVTTGTIATHLRNIPNQPLVFKDDPEKKHRTEDAIIAWTWKKFLSDTSNPSILLRLPMTKAVIRAMDTIEHFARTNNFGQVKKFMLAGESKRGWTTWTSAAVDTKRVFSAVPIVMDILNMNTNLHKNFRSLGGWTFAFSPYYELNITKYVDSREIFELQKIVDPISYLDRYKETNILVMTTSGDEFFLPENTNSYWDNLVAATDGKVLLRRLPNAEHEIYEHAISEFASLRSFFLSTYEKSLLPKVKWIMPNNSTHGIIRARIDVTSGSPKPYIVKCYYANTLGNTRRDFRLVIADPNDSSKEIPHPVVWFSTDKNILTNETKSEIFYEIAFKKPYSGWLGFFLQFNFKGLDYSVNVVTTETNIVPETFPFDDCSRESCLGKLV